MSFALLTLFALLLSTGQILFKKAALAGVGGGLFASFLNVWMIAALVLYASATLLWVYILRTIPLSTAYPFVALGFIVVPIAGVMIFGEEIGWRYFVGSFLIVSGIAVISAT